MTQITTQITKLIMAVLIIALIVSLSFNSYYHYVVLPQLQTDTNHRKTAALEGWLDEMQQVDATLKAANTTEGVLQAYDDNLGYAQYFAAILGGGPPEEFYNSIITATNTLDDALNAMYFGNETGAIYSRNLNQAELSTIANLTYNLDGVLFRSAHLKYLSYDYLKDWLYYSNSMANMDPAQELREVGVNMTNVIGCLNQITQISTRIIWMYPS